MLVSSGILDSIPKRNIFVSKYYQKRTMATLKRETSVLPENLFEVESQPDATDALWWVLHTSPRMEKSLARQLCRHRIPFYLPLYEKRTKQQRRVVYSYVPLFSGYVFLLANEQQRSTAFHTNLIVNCLEVSDQKRLWSDLRRIHGLCESGEFVTPEHKLQVGTSAEITSGPLKGYRGTIVRNASSTRFVIDVDFLQCGASVEVDASCVRAL